MAEAKLFSIKYKSYDCQHSNVELDMDSRTVKCIHCERTIDAFDFLMSCSVNEDSAIARLDRRLKEVAKLEKEIERLKKYKGILTNPTK